MPPIGPAYGSISSGSGGGGGGGGGATWRISERRAEAVTALPATTPANINFEVAGINDAGGDLTWDGVNFAWENTSGGVLYCNVLVTIACQAVSSGRPVFILKLDTGGGFADIVNSNFWNETGRMSAAKAYRMDLNAGDKLAVAGAAIVFNVNMIQGSSFQIHSTTTQPS